MSAHGFTIFCDDVRYETGNKLSYMGVYDSELIVIGEYPIVVPKLLLSVVYMADPESENHQIDLAIFLPGNLSEQPNYVAKLDVISAEPSDEMEKFGLGRVAYAMDLIELSPFTVTERGFVRVRAYREGWETRLGALEIKTGEIL
jgi:hypothetical protein